MVKETEILRQFFIILTLCAVNLSKYLLYEKVQRKLSFKVDKITRFAEHLFRLSKKGAREVYRTLQTELSLFENKLLTEVYFRSLEVQSNLHSCWEGNFDRFLQLNLHVFFFSTHNCSRKILFSSKVFGNLGALF